MTTAHGDINIRASHMKLHTALSLCVGKQCRGSQGEKLNLANMQGGLQSWMLFRLLAGTDLMTLKDY